MRIDFGQNALATPPAAQMPRKKESADFSLHFFRTQAAETATPEVESSAEEALAPETTVAEETVEELATKAPDGALGLTDATMPDVTGLDSELMADGFLEPSEGGTPARTGSSTTPGDTTIVNRSQKPDDVPRSVAAPSLGLPALARSGNVAGVVHRSNGINVVSRRAADLMPLTTPVGDPVADPGGAEELPADRPKLGAIPAVPPQSRPIHAETKPMKTLNEAVETTLANKKGGEEAKIGLLNDAEAGAENRPSSENAKRPLEPAAAQVMSSHPTRATAKPQDFPESPFPFGAALNDPELVEQPERGREPAASVDAPRERPSRGTESAANANTRFEIGASAGLVSLSTGLSMEASVPALAVEEAMTLSFGGEQPLATSGAYQPMAAVATSQPFTITSPREIANQIVMASASLEADGQVTELTLHPEELGRVRMQLRTDGAHATIHITTERPEVADLMRRHSSDLAQDYRSQGFTSISLSFSGSGKDQSSAQSEAKVRGAEPDEQTEIAQADPIRRGRSIGGGGLDLRL